MDVTFSSTLVSARKPAWLAVAVLLAAGPVWADAPKTPPLNLDRALLTEAAPKVLKYLEDNNLQNVGVVKFLVQKGDKGTPSDNVGPLNLSIANRLEVALVLQNSSGKVGVIRGASAVARAQLPRANHLTAEGRLAFFDAKPPRTIFPLAWGKQSVAADAMVTGLVKLSSDLKKTTVQVDVFSAKNSKDPARVAEFSVTTDARTLAEAGESFAVRRGLFTADDTIELAMAPLDAAQEVAQGKPNPVTPQNLDAPIELEIYYDNQKQPITIQVGHAGVAEPTTNQKVHFVLRNKTVDTYGVVLMINGINTLYEQRLPAEQCTKWILGSKESVTINGWQIGDKDAREFKVLSREKSREDEVNYGEHAGTFRLEAFLEKKAGSPPPAGIDDLINKVGAVQRGQLPGPALAPDQLSALQAWLQFDKKVRNREEALSRGLIAKGGQLQREVEKLPVFMHFSIPAMAAVIEYYKPSKPK